MDEPWRDVDQAGEWLLGLEEAFRPDIIHLNGCAHGVLPWKTPVLVVAHSCVLSWWLAVKGEPAPECAWREYTQRLGAGLHAADVVVAPTQAMLESVRRLYGSPEQTRVIPNGRNPELFRASVEKEPFVISAGRLWDEAKNISMLDRIARDIDWPVFLAGHTVAPANDAPVMYSGVCRSLGFVNPETLAGLLARAAIFCLPAKYEPFGLTVLEAALSGCALVLGDIPSLRESWDGAAVFVPPDNDAALASALNDLILCLSKRMAIAECANRRGSVLTSERMAAEYLELYSSLAGSPARRRNTVGLCAS
jgi:glycosyltransferase involved in cell wall biosynthesis